MIDRAKKGDRTALPRLREYLELNPSLWERPGNVGLQAQAAWIRLIAGPNLHLQEVTARKINAMKREYAGDAPTPMESLLVERIVTAWLRLAYVEAREALCHETSIKWAQLQMQRQAQAERQFRAAIDALANLRKAQKTITVELRQPTTVPLVEPIIAKPINGEQSAINGHAVRQQKVNGTAKPVNRLNGAINGHHSRFGDTLDLVSTG